MTTYEDADATRDRISASGGLLTPLSLYDQPRYFAVIRMKPWRQRPGLWLRGEPTFDIDVYDREAIPRTAAMLPNFSTRRGIQVAE